MELVQYYTLNRNLLSSLGLWPYDNFKVRQLRFILTLFIMVSFISSQLMKLFVSEYDLDLFIQIIPFNMIFITLVIKYITVYMREFQDRLQNNWNALIDNQEIEIIRKQAIIGKLFTQFLTIFACSALFVSFIIQYISILLDVIIPLNESRPRELLFPVEYFIDQQKYFPILTILTGIGFIVSSMSALATESFSFVNALHAFGLFKVASYRMKHILLSQTNFQICTTKQYIISRHRIIAAVDFHRRAIEYSELLKRSFGPMYLMYFVVLVSSTSINLFNLLRALMSNRILHVFKSLIFIFIYILSVTLANYAGQKFIDYDTLVYQTICNMKWYDAPLKIQKLIFFLIQKTTKCYKVDAGGMFNPCFEGLATVFSMTISYFLVFPP
ncbi:Odorant receptor 313 [Nylanderia fulva]|uniref:Odorant receptor n=1 Tax=Nylanderia fulva TaxID=613905 RepID=A0A6G1LQ57_9HYME|nr:Odorant receptor 313 [Nylanderia fulva]